MADEMKKVAEAEAMTGETPETRETECTKDEAPLIRIVDDDGDLRDALLYMLSQEGWEAAAFPDAESFLRSAAPSAPGVLILDVRMPGMSGIELHRELRHGAFHFLQKPLDPEKLLSAVAQAVEPTAESGSACRPSRKFAPASRRFDPASAR